MLKPLKGLYTALITPFKNDALDVLALRKQVQFQIANRVDGIIPIGTTGESSTLTPDERKEIINVCVEEAEGRVPVIIGCGTNCTRTTISNVEQAKNMGADGALLITPYYNKPTQEGLFLHFKAVAESSDFPLILYNCPGRTGVTLEVETVLRLTKFSTIIGIKDATGQTQHISRLMRHLRNDTSAFTVLSGDDSLTLPMMSLGATGVISVVSNLIPGLMGKLVRSLDSGDYERARRFHFNLLPFMEAAFIETNPIPIKAAMNLYGMQAGDCRLPLTKIQDKHLDQLHDLLIQLQLADYD